MRQTLEHVFLSLYKLQVSNTEEEEKMVLLKENSALVTMLESVTQLLLQYHIYARPCNEEKADAHSLLRE